MTNATNATGLTVKQFLRSKLATQPFMLWAEYNDSDDNFPVDRIANTIERVRKLPSYVQHATILYTEQLPEQETLDLYIRVTEQQFLDLDYNYIEVNNVGE